MGIVLHSLMLLRTPKKGDKIPENYSRDLRKLCQNMTAKLSEDRFTLKQVISSRWVSEYTTKTGF